MCRVCRLGGPISLQAALVFISSLVSLAFAGHLGKLSLSQAVLATSAYNITGVSMLLGLASGMETLCSQVPRTCLMHPCGKLLQCVYCLQYIDGDGGHLSRLACCTGIWGRQLHGVRPCTTASPHHLNAGVSGHSGAMDASWPYSASCGWVCLAISLSISASEAPAMRFAPRTGLAQRCSTERGGPHMC